MNVRKIDYSDSAVWDLFCAGKTTCVFQCESPLVKKWLKKIKPRNLWELAAVVAGVRPGPLLSGMMETYVNNKFNPNKIEKFNNTIVDNILSNTYFVLLYQEQIMELGKQLAWPHLSENERLVNADRLRKAIGKKDQRAVLEIGKEFVDGCLHNNVDKELADKLFDLLKKSGRYVFNLSHAASYAKLGFETAYLKARYPHETFISWLNASIGCQKPQEEIYIIIQDSRAFGFHMIGPNINNHNLDFEKHTNKQILYGLGHIKHTGNTLTKIIDSLPKITTWQQVMKLGLTDTIVKKPRSTVMEALICSGCFKDTNINRKQLLDIYYLLANITDKERDYAISQIDNINISQIATLIESIAINISASVRRQIMLSEAEILKKSIITTDDPEWIEEQEIKYLGCPISPTITQQYEYLSNYTCYDCNQVDNGENIEYINIIGRLDSVNIREIKTGKNKGRLMAQVSIRDSTGRLSDLPIFADTYSENSVNIITKNIVELVMSHKTERGFMVKSVRLINAK